MILLGSDATLRNDIEIKSDSIVINDLYVKTFLVEDYPRFAETGLLYDFTHGQHKQPGVNVNFAIHYMKSNVKFDYFMKTKMDRLQNSIAEAEKSGKLSETAREEEVEALRGLIHLRDNIKAGRVADVWTTFTISSNDEKLFKKAIKAFEDEMERLELIIDPLDEEQNTAINSAWIGGKIPEFFKKHSGRPLDMDALGALYPYMDGTISDGSGCYFAHRVCDKTAVYKDFTKGTDNQNILAVGLTGTGKSTFLKSLALSMLIENMKVYIYDVDGEYRSLCDEVGGIWADYTMGTGLFVDPTVLERSISSEMDIKDFDEKTQKLIIDSDKARFNDAVTNTRAVISLLVDNFDIDKRNAMERALGEMWTDAGISKKHHGSWDDFNRDKVNIFEFYERIKVHAQKDEGARQLQKYLWTYFEGLNSDMFENAAPAEWLNDNKLIVFHVASSADNDVDQQMGAVKIVMITHMVWQRIKRDRLKRQYFSAEIYDEFQRLEKNPHAKAAPYRSITTSRKYNSQCVLGFNDPWILFGKDGKPSAAWDNTRYKCFFPLEESSIKELSQNSYMPQEVRDIWSSLTRPNFIFREKTDYGDKYDILKVRVPDYEIETLSKTRGL